MVNIHNTESICENKVEQETYISLASTLHYPTILLSSQGTIVFKNSKAEKIRGKWRRGANIKTYVGQSILENILTTKKGEYTDVSLDDEKIATLRFDDYYFLLFMNDFELNEEHIFPLYEYMSCIPEKNLFIKRNNIFDDNAIIVDDNYDAFRRKFEHFYKETSNCFSEVNELCLKKNFYAEHNIIEIMQKLSDFINKRPYNFSCKCSLLKSKDCFIRCSSRDFGAIFSVLFFLCLQCSCSKKPSVLLKFEKTENSYSHCVSLSVKSRLCCDDIENIFYSKEFPDERALYFQTAKNMSDKYFWGLGVKKKDEYIVFSLKMVTSTQKDSWFRDASSKELAQGLLAFESFMDILLNESPSETE